MKKNITKSIVDTINFGKEVYPLMILIRYNNVPRIINESVASHSHQVSIIALELYEKLKDKLKLNLSLILSMAIIHDLPEAYYGDIAYPVKRKIKGLKTLLEKAEKDYLHKLLGYKYESIYDSYCNKDCPEALIVKLADVISCNIYSKKEVELGNTKMKSIIRQSSKDIQELQKKIEKLIGEQNGK